MNEKKSIKEWAADDRPREKMMAKGKASLSNAELIAILIGSGNSELSAVELSRAASLTASTTTSSASPTSL